MPEFVDSCGRARRSFRVGDERQREGSSVGLAVLLQVIRREASAPLRAALEEISCHFAETWEVSDGLVEVARRWRNPTMHGERSFCGAAALALNLSLLLVNEATAEGHHT